VGRILIAGCGYVGAAAADQFHDAGWMVEGWTQTGDSALALAGKPYSVRSVDISAADQIGTSLAGHFDAVVHCASTRGGDANAYHRVYRMGAANLMARFAEAMFLFISSTSVYAQKNGQWVTEESPAEPEHDTGKILRDTERLVLRCGGTVLRLGGIYGPGRSAILKKFLNGEGTDNAANDRFLNQVHRDDIVGALLLLLEKSSAPAQIYNVIDDNPLRQSECYRWLASRLQRPLLASNRPMLTRKRGESNKRVSNRKLRAAGWTLQYPSFAEGMNKSVLPSFGF
jgi:nucleoside-diphosphate-sugar epimerase